MSLNVFEACFIINKVRGEGLVVSTMSAMFAASAIAPGPHNLSSVPLMGGASGLGLGLALAQPNRPIFVLDGDASLLMELGTLASIAEQAPANLVYFVFNNNTQFASLANVDRPGGANVDFQMIARGAGFQSTHGASSIPELVGLKDVLQKPGPHFIELAITPQPRLVKEIPQPTLPDMQFTRMGNEAAAMMELLGVTRG